MVSQIKLCQISSIDCIVTSYFGINVRFYRQNAALKKNCGLVVIKTTCLQNSGYIFLKLTPPHKNTKWNWL